MSSTRFTLGNLDKGIGVAIAVAMSQLVTAAGDWKFTDHQAKDGGGIAPLPWNVELPLPTKDHGAWQSLSCRETQISAKAGIRYGFCDANGHYVGNVGQDQDKPASLTRAQWVAAGSPGLFWRAEYPNTTNDVATFQFGAG